MATFTNWAGTISLPVVRYEDPENLGDLRKAVLLAEHDGLKIHALGSGWAFSAPAYSEGVMVKTHKLIRFPSILQQSIRQIAGPSLLVAVEAGIKIRNLYKALHGQPRPDRGQPVPDALLNGRKWTLPTLGGAGAQSIAGAISTGTHGGDVARPPIGDFVHAILMVGSRGEIRLIQRSTQPVDAGGLERSLRSQLLDLRFREFHDDDTLNAAIVSVGRFGIVYAYVLEVVDETDDTIIEHRRTAMWTQVKDDLLNHNIVGQAEAGDEFLQFLINPVPAQGGGHRCYITFHKKTPTHLLGNAALLFDLPMNVRSRRVVDERAGSPFAADVGQALCATQLTPLWVTIRDTLNWLGVYLTLQFFPFGFLLAQPLWRVAASIDRLGPGHVTGDVIADLFNLLQDYHLQPLVEVINRHVIESGQSDRRSDGQPWLVHGTRWEIADIYDYNNEGCYTGDSVEIFFPADSTLPDKIDSVLQVFEDLRREGMMIGAYFAVRFMRQSSSLLGMARFSPSCSLEISMMRGLNGNASALTRIQDIAINGGGRIHWGQQNDLSKPQVDAMYGIDIETWRTRLQFVEGDSLTFSNPFTLQRGLEPDQPENWDGWTDTGLVANSSPGVVSSGSGMPLEVFALDNAKVVNSLRRPSSGAPPLLRQIRPESLDSDATPVVVRRKDDGRIELFARNGRKQLVHCYEQSRGGQFSTWDTKGGTGGPEITFDPAVGWSADGRIEVFARGSNAKRFRLLHSWTLPGTGLWTALDVIDKGDEQLGGPPNACQRSYIEGVTAVTKQLLVVSTILPEGSPESTGGGIVIWKVPNMTGWEPWRQLHAPDELPRIAGGLGSPIAINVTGAGARVHVIIIDARGDVFEALEADRASRLSWLPWQPLPALAPTDRLDPNSRLAYAQTVNLWLFGLTQRGQVMAIEFVPGHGWGTWLNLGGPAAGSVAAGSQESGLIEVFARRESDSHLMARRQTMPGQW